MGKANEAISKENSTFQLPEKQTSDSVLKVMRLAIKEGFQVHRMVVNLAKDTVMKSARIYLVFKRIEADGSQIIFSEPSVEEIEKENFDETVKLFLITKKSTLEIQDRISNVSDVESVSVQKVEIESSDIPTLEAEPFNSNSLVEVLLIEISNQTYAIPLSDVNRLISIASENVKFVQNAKVFVIGNEVIPLIDMQEYFGESANSNERLEIVVVDHESTHYGLVVDKFLKNDKITLNPLGQTLKNAKDFSGATILQDGTIAMMINVDFVVRNFSHILKTNMSVHGEHDGQC